MNLPVVSNLQRIDSNDWNRPSPRPNDSYNSPARSSYQTNVVGGGYDQPQQLYQQPQQPPVDYGQVEYVRRDSRPSSRASSRPGSRSNSRPPSRPMSRASSQQRIYDQDQVVSESPTDWRQQRSLSRNDSQRSLTEYQQQLRQPDPIITTRIDESGILETRKPSVTFRNDEYEQQSQNIQQMVEQRSPIYDNGGHQPQQQQYQEPVYEQQSYQQPAYQPEYSYGSNQQYSNYEQPPQQNMGPAVYSTSNFEPQPEQFTSGSINTNQYEQPRPYISESRRQSPDKEVYQQQQQPRPTYQTDSRRQSPEQDYPTSYIEPETPKRSTPPKRESPPRQQSAEEVAKVVQQRQQSRDQLYGREKTESPEDAPRSPSAQQRQQSREIIQETSQKSPSPTSTPSSQTISPAPQTKGSTKAPPSPTRNRGKPPAKSGAEQKESRNSVGEASRAGRKPDTVQKQPAKAVAGVRGKK